jgi:hypothetical protein
MINDEQNEFRSFLNNNPDMMLPIASEFEGGLVADPTNGTEILDESKTPAEILEESEHSPPWSVVVRREKARTKSNKIDQHDRRIFGILGV